MRVQSDGRWPFVAKLLFRPISFSPHAPQQLTPQSPFRSSSVSTSPPITTAFHLPRSSFSSTDQAYHLEQLHAL